MMEFPYPISREVHTQLMVVAIDVAFPREDIGPAPFSTMRPPPMGHPFTEVVSGPPVPLLAVEWEWMAAASTRTPNAPTLVFSPPPAVASTPVPPTGAASGGSWRHQRSPSRHGWSPPHSSSPQHDR
jgi:hypothetical protein